MTTRRNATGARLRIVQVRSQIGNQTRVKRVLTDGLGLGRIGSSVVQPDNPYTRGMITKVAHIVSFQEIAGEPHAVREVEHRAPVVEPAVVESAPVAPVPPTRTAAAVPTATAASHTAGRRSAGGPPRMDSLRTFRTWDIARRVFGGGAQPHPRR